ncbi:MAG TPA: DNA repair protein RecO [Spirochaetia bacterium]|nr:MAG: DNA repair protein RecO [Spirochaetes bacterium GWB1_36_13]HCL57065.1 DNA repair protein RecO [Spirochaetia bacterium]
MKSGRKIHLEGIIVYSMNYAESHKIFRIFTPDHGIVPAMAYGARKMKSKFRGKLETLNWVEGSFSIGKNSFYILEEVEIKVVFTSGLSYEVIWKIFPFLKFINLSFFEKKEENIKIFQMFAVFLKQLDKDTDEKKMNLLIYSFVIKYLIIHSIVKNPKYCSLCGEENQSGIAWNIKNGMTVCKKCAVPESIYRFFDQNLKEFLIKIIYSKFEEIIYLIVKDDELEFLRETVDFLLFHHLNKKWEDFEINENPFNS